MNVLVIGSGGREHALVWKLAQSSHVSKLYCAPGNAGSWQLAEGVPIAADDIPALCNFAREQRIALTVVGPEVPLALGITDTFAASDLCVFGPTRAAAQLESSKVFAKDFMQEHGIPTAASVVCDAYSAAVDYIRLHRGPLVVKADGLAAGKGVIVCQTQEQALQAVQQTMQERVFGDAGRRVVLEEYLVGEEVSFHVLVDGEQIVSMASAQDHKQVYDDDQGPNTGGMGAYSPAPVMTEALHQRIMTDIIRPTVQGLADQGTPYRGALYAGLMIVAGQPYVLEFNARFGDPEAQPLLVRLADDLLPLLDAAARGGLTGLRAEFVPEPAVCVVMASGGYPETYATGFPITGLDGVAHTENTWLFHAGTEVRDDRVVTSGGRVLGVTARAASITSAIRQAYDVVERIQWSDVHYRRDVGHRAVQRPSS
ncbi:Phosphoribosylamine--glycine ligase [Candidatus Entotheonellaceae bacterium PAL068K]